MIRKEFNVIITGINPDSDRMDVYKDTFFGPVMKCDEFKVYETAPPFYSLMRDLGLFRSSSQAKKNGWDKPVPAGWTELEVGKLKHRLCILNLEE